MNKLPERIYLNEDANTAFNGIAYQIEPTYLLNKSVEYIRKDVVEEMAKEFAEFVIDDQIDNDSFDDLFTEFLNNKAHDF